MSGGFPPQSSHCWPSLLGLPVTHSALWSPCSAMHRQFTLWPQVQPRRDRPGVASGPLLQRRCEAPRPYRQLPWPGEAPRRMVFAASACRASSSDFTTQDLVSSPFLIAPPCSPTAYLRPLSDLAPSRRGPMDAAPRAPAVASLRWDTSGSNAAAVFSDFGCFGFLVSRFDRRWPFAIIESFYTLSIQIPAACWKICGNPAAHSSFRTLQPRSGSVTRNLAVVAFNNCCLLATSTRVLPQESFLRILTRADSRERSRQSPLPNRLSRQIRVVHNPTEASSDRQLWQERRVAQRIWRHIPEPALPPPRCWPDRGPSGRPCCPAPIRTAKSPKPW